MDRLKSNTRHLESSATHRIIQPSTTLNRRYVKPPIASNAGRYSSAMPKPEIEEVSVRPSRLINLRLHADELLEDNSDSAYQSLPEQSVDDAHYSEISSVSYYDNDCVVDDASQSAEIDHDSSAYAEFNPELADPELVASDYSEPEEESSPVSMYALEEMKRNMMQDLVANRPAEIVSTEPEHDVSPQNENNSGALMTESDNSISSDMINDTSGYDPNKIKNNDEAPANESIDLISKATSDALASIRIATETSEVSTQMASLKAFADSIKTDSPEMAELSNTIEKFANVAMKSSKAKAEAESKVAMNVNRSSQISQSSSRINRSPMSKSQPSSDATSSPYASRAGARPVAHIASRAPKTAIQPHSSSLSTTSSSRRATKVASKNATRTPFVAERQPARPSAKVAKRSKPKQAQVPDDRALERTLRSVATMNETTKNTKSAKKRRSAKVRKKGGFARFMIAFGCAAGCIAGIAYLVGSNIPDISVQVAAMQTGIEASYPTYVPREYSLGDISSEDGRLTMRFNGPDDQTFTITEEKSSWDSSALQRNYVEPTWGEDFTTTHEQGITIYISGSDAAWVNGGILYKIDASTNNLSKKQLRNIVTSL